MSQFSGNKHRDQQDDVVLAQIGRRLANQRVRLNITQQKLAEEAGVSRSTLTRLEAGESTQLTAFIRVIRALKLLDGLDAWLPADEPSPLQILKNKGQARQRASSPRKEEPDDSKPWQWGEDQ